MLGIYALLYLKTGESFFLILRHWTRLVFLNLTDKPVFSSMDFHYKITQRRGVIRLKLK